MIWMYPPMVQICISQMVICLLSVFEAAGNLKAMLTWGIVYLPLLYTKSLSASFNDIDLGGKTHDDLMFAF